MPRGPANLHQITLFVPDGLADMSDEDKQVQVAECIKELGQQLFKQHKVGSPQYITVLLSSAAMYAGFGCNPKDPAHVVEVKITCPSIVRDMIKTLGEFYQAGFQQRLQIEVTKAAPTDGVRN